MPSALRSSGSSSARIVSSSIASTRPAPKVGIGMRRAMMLASAGSTGWQPCVGFEKRWKSVSSGEPSGSVSGRIAPCASRYAARTSDTRLTPPTAGTLWQTAQLRAVERRAEPFFRRLHLEKVVEADPEALELGREKAGQRIAERAAAAAPARAADRPTSGDNAAAQDAARWRDGVSAHDPSALRVARLHLDRAAHEAVAGAAQPGTLEGVAARRRSRRTARARRRVLAWESRHPMPCRRGQRAGSRGSCRRSSGAARPSRPPRP